MNRSPSSTFVLRVHNRHRSQRHPTSSIHHGRQHQQRLPAIAASSQELWGNQHASSGSSWIIDFGAKLTVEVFKTKGTLNASAALAALGHANSGEADLGEEVGRILETETGLAVCDPLHRPHGVVIPENQHLDLIRSVAVSPGLDVDLGARLRLRDEHGAERKDLGGLHDVLRIV